MRELSLHILDISQNSLEAGADRIVIKIEENIDKNRFKITISDNGRGIKKDVLNNVTDPFVTSRNTRNVGLGLALLKQSAKQCAGDIKIKSTAGRGTTVKAYFNYNHIDRPPLGSITDTVITILALNPDIRLKFIYRVNEKEFVFDTDDLQRKLAGVQVNNSQVLNWIDKFLQKNIESLPGGELDEITTRTA